MNNVHNKSRLFCLSRIVTELWLLVVMRCLGLRTCKVILGRLTKCIVTKEKRIELYFCEHKGDFVLERIRFCAGVHHTWVDTFRGDRYGRVGASFSWTRAMRAVALILVRHAICRDASLRGGAGSPAQTLHNLLVHPERSAAAIPFTTADRHCHLKSILELNNPGVSLTGGSQRWVGVNEERWPSSSIYIYLGGDLCTDLRALQAISTRLASIWEGATNEVSSGVQLPYSGGAKPLELNSIEGWNQLTADFYRTALDGGSLAAMTMALSRIVPGALQMAFTAGPDGQVDFHTSGGVDGLQFCLATMGTTQSHPLIYRCRGQVRAILDVLDDHAWTGRAMYQAAKPILAMEDALGTDLPLAGGRTLNACIIRERRFFTDRERQHFAWMLPHFRTVAEWMPSSAQSSGLRILDVSAIAGAVHRPLAQHRDVCGQLGALLPDVGDRAWLYDHLNGWLANRFKRKRTTGPQWIYHPQTRRPLAMCLPEKDGSPAKILVAS